MKDIFVLAEHRQGEIREVTYELLTGGAVLAPKMDAQLTAVLLGSGVDAFAEDLKGWANRVIVVDEERLKDFNADLYQDVLEALWKEHKPALTLIPQSGFGVDLAPSLAVALDLPVTTDCYQIDVQGEQLTAFRQMYGGKVNAQVSFGEADGIIITIRSCSYTIEQSKLSGEIVKVDSPLTEEISVRKFIEYVEAAIGDVDITQADIVIGIGRGIKEPDNLKVVEELAASVGGVMTCSRPVVDAGWLPKDRQVGSSGKTIKPKLYIALGISGAFQHAAGMKGSETIVAVNKDCNAPIFGIADYGIVGDLFKVVPVLKQKIDEIKAN